MRSTTLQADVGPCSGNGIIVGADNITLNLNGHRIFGTDGTAADGSSATAGVRLPMRTGVVIVGGSPGSSIDGFDAGVFINGGSANTVQNLNIHDNIGSNNLDLALLGDGIAVFNLPSNRILNNALIHNGLFDNVAVLGSASNDNTIMGNTVTDSPYANSRESGNGIVINAFLDTPTGKLIHGNNVSDNVIKNNGRAGISNVNHSDASLERNTIIGDPGGADDADGIGVSFGSQPETRTSNLTIQDNVVSGFAADGIYLNVANGNTVLRNTITGTRIYEGIGIYGYGNNVKYNKVQHGATSVVSRPIGGFFFEPDRNTIEVNTVTDNRYDGIDGLRQRTDLLGMSDYRFELCRQQCLGGSVLLVGSLR